VPEQAGEETGATCTCEQPIPVERATRKGAALTECARCERPVPLRLPLR
jgi:hypothetical protein